MCIFHGVGILFLHCSFRYGVWRYLQFEGEYYGSVVIPNSVQYNGKTYSVTSIGDYTFDQYTGLTNVTIPNSVTSIGRMSHFGGKQRVD